MPLSVALQYGLYFFVILLVSALFLLLSTSREDTDSRMATKRGLLNTHILPIESLPLFDVSTSAIKSIALPFGRRDLALKLSFSPSPTLVCSGGKFLEKIQAASKGSSPPGREYTSTDLDNGWRLVPPFPGVVPDTRLDKYWSSVFTEANGKQLDLRFINNPTKAYSTSLSIPSLHFLISLNSLSPVAVLSRRTPSISKQDRNALPSSLSRLSDILWLNWLSTSATPRYLRYIGISKISNQQSGSAMDYLFNRDASGKNPQKKDIPWPGLEYGGESDGLKALLATPNGIADAWMLIDHAVGMRGKVEGEGLARTELRVNILEAERDCFMLWDI
ncbi:MAG: hypothetical protein Q9169_007835 [Polycauliona sp. 2 TL-2023]